MKAPIYSCQFQNTDEPGRAGMLYDPQPQQPSTDFTPIARRNNPLVGIRKLGAAILLRGIADYRKARDLEIWKDAEAFLFPEDADRQQHFRWALDCIAVDPQWLNERLARVRRETREPKTFLCKAHGTLPISESRDGKCKKCRREKIISAHIATRVKRRGESA